MTSAVVQPPAAKSACGCLQIRRRSQKRGSLWWKESLQTPMQLLHFHTYSVYLWKRSLCLRPSSPTTPESLLSLSAQARNHSLYLLTHWQNKNHSIFCWPTRAALIIFQVNNQVSSPSQPTLICQLALQDRARFPSTDCPRWKSWSWRQPTGLIHPFLSFSEHTCSLVTHRHMLSTGGTCSQNMIEEREKVWMFYHCWCPFHTKAPLPVL